MRQPQHTARASQSTHGFTLIELMIVVAILGILATIAVGAYSKNVRVARRTEVIGDLSNIALKEDAFFSVRGHYASTTDSEDDTYPVIPAELQNYSVAIPWDIADPKYTRVGANGAFFRQGGNEHGFDALNFMPESARSFCAYGVISGDGTNGTVAQDEPPNNNLGGDVFPMGNGPARFYARDWFYAFAVCDLDSDGVYWHFTRPHYTSQVSFGDGSEFGE